MIRITQILEKAKNHLSQQELELIQKAYVFAAAAHAGQVRLSGEPYLSHPLAVANILADLYIDGPTIVAGLLHDTIEDTAVSLEEIQKQFGQQVAKIVDGVTKISKIDFLSKEEAKAENIRKMILAMAEDIRVVLVKLADRLHNMRTLEHQKELKQKLISQETLEIYAPLANRLGLYRIKAELEDLSLRYLKPDVYFQIKEGIRHLEVAGEKYMAKVISTLERLLEQNKIKGRVSGRLKHIYSIHHKMETQNLSLDQVHDIIAFRIIVKSIRDCYAVVGLVHDLWKPVQGKFKDYISMPKANMYQSIHTTVIGPEGKRLEIQIRTEEMHKIAEYGIAAHWKYKEDGVRLKSKDVQRFSWLRQILDWQKELKDSKEFLTSLRFDLFEDEIYVFTPKGEVKELPEGATPVDFAYLIHTQVGDRCVGAKVNGKLVSLDTPLKTGDVVEIITDPNKHPSRDWLSFVKTAKARTRIKHWIKTKEKQISIDLGQEYLTKEAVKLGIELSTISEQKWEEVAKEFSLNSKEELFSALGYDTLRPRQVLHRLCPKSETSKTTKDKPKEKKPCPRGVCVKGVDDVLIRFARCCNPVPGDPIVGYISRGKGVTVHTFDCPNVKNMEPERQIPVFWDQTEQKNFPAKIKITCLDIPGMLAKISQILYEQDVNITSGSFQGMLDGHSQLDFTLMVRDSRHLYDTIAALQKLKGVKEVKRAIERQSKNT